MRTYAAIAPRLWRRLLSSIDGGPAAQLGGRFPNIRSAMASSARMSYRNWGPQEGRFVRFATGGFHAGAMSF